MESRRTVKSSGGVLLYGRLLAQAQKGYEKRLYRKNNLHMKNNKQSE